MENRRRNGRVHEAGRNPDRRFFRLRRLHAEGSPCSGRSSRDPRRLGRQLEERQRALAALQADLCLLWRSERFALAPAASVGEAQSS